MINFTSKTNFILLAFIYLVCIKKEVIKESNMVMAAVASEYKMVD